MNLNDFQYIVTIAELKSFNAASKALFVTQPSLSQRVKYIENSYGIRIFERNMSGVALTADGECFVKHAQRILSNDADLKTELEYLRESARMTLRFGFSWVFDTPFFYNLFFRFCNEHPQIYFELMEQSSEDLQESLLSNKIDIALCYLPIHSKELSYQIIYNDSYVLMPASDSSLTAKIQQRNLSPGSFLEPALLNGETFSICSSGKRLHQYLTDVIEQEHISPNIRHMIRGVSLLYTLALNGLSSTILYKSYFLSDSVTAPYYYLDTSVNSNLSLALVWRRNSHYRHLAKEFIQLI